MHIISSRQGMPMGRWSWHRLWIYLRLNSTTITLNSKTSNIPHNSKCKEQKFVTKNLLDPYLSQILKIELDNFHPRQTVGGFKIDHPATFSVFLSQCLVKLGPSWEFAWPKLLFERHIIQKCLYLKLHFSLNPIIKCVEMNHTEKWFCIL